MSKLSRLIKKWRQRLRDRKYKRVRLAMVDKPHDVVFTEIFKAKYWGDFDSVSGPGSTLPQTKHVIEWLPHALRELQVASMLDIPCGDFHWMQHVNLEGVQYIGADIVPEIIQANTAEHAGTGREFRTLDLCASSLPRVDLIFTRDCLVHLPHEMIWDALDNVRRSGAHWLMATCFPNTVENKDIRVGEWRRLNLMRPPFNFPHPKLLKHEGTPEFDDCDDKHLAVWAVEDFPLRS